MPLRLGLHAGDVIREDNNVYGGAVNIASRVSGLCQISQRRSLAAYRRRLCGNREAAWLLVARMWLVDLSVLLGTTFSRPVWGSY
ncbi:MAG: hypothetical protein E6J42_07835 [Chloroflexi bacterium]|nr:MAG: hypothetical protein E6J42_07835 [Chloroflexota bacterium]